MDVARTAVRHGSKTVTVYVRGEKVNASPDEFEMAVVDGVDFVYMKSPVRITDDGIVLTDIADDGNGGFVPVPGTEKLYEASSVMVCISQVPQDRLVNRDRELRLNERGNLATNEDGETTMPGVFASGDVVTGARTVVEAAAFSKKIAEDMDRYMQAHRD